MDRDAFQGIGAVFMGLGAIGGTLAGAYGYVLPGIIAGGLLIAAGGMLVVTAITNRKRKE